MNITQHIKNIDNAKAPKDNPSFAGVVSVESSIIFEGSTADANETTLTVTNPTADRTITIPDASGTILLSGNPSFSAYQSTLQSLTVGVSTKLFFQTEEWDTTNAFDSTTNYRFQPTVAGYYNVLGGFAISANNNMRLFLYKNGTLYRNMQQIPAYNGFIGGGGTVYLNGSTDYIELYGLSSATVNTSIGSANTYFQANYISGV